jgi:Na+/H+ antiporter NhaD/arsenite permease-like protein
MLLRVFAYERDGRIYLKKIELIFRKEPVLTIAALLAAISMVITPPSGKYLSYIDGKTLACLFCLMASVTGLKREGLLEKISLVISAHIKRSRAMVFFLVFSCYFLGMLITNDVALITVLPITLAILPSCGLDRWAALIVVLQTIAANIGSALTPFGNPQNLFLFSYFKMNPPDFFLTTAPVVFTGGLLLAGSCLIIPAIPLNPYVRHSSNLIRTRKAPAYAYALLFLLSVAAVFDFIPFWIAAAIVFAVTLAVDFHTLAEVDYSLLATFVVIFVFVGNLGANASVHAFLSDVSQKSTILAAILTSQVTSNVPAAILLSGFTDNAKDLLLGTNIGGLGTLIASMASVISFKIYTGMYKGRSVRFLKLFTVWNILFLAILTIIGMLLIL